MDGLRWLLLFFGLLLVAGVYWYSRREQQPKAEPKPVERRAPTIDNGEAADTNGQDYFAADAPDEVSDGTPEGESPAIDTDRAPQKVVTLRLIARGRGAFPGDELVLSLRGIGMRHGKFGIFHRYDGNDEARVIFSAASLIEPGSFELADVKNQEIPGISLFLVLPGPVEGVESFDLMMAASRTLAQSLDAELLDESGSNLSIQRERYMREEIVQYEHSNKVA